MTFEFDGFGFHPAVAHRLVFGGVGLEFRSVERDVAEFDESCFLADLQDLNEESGEGFKVSAAEFGDSVVVGMLVGGDDAKGNLLVSGLLDLSRTRQPNAVGVKQ